MYLNTNNHNECCGCAMCADVCPVDAISMSDIFNGHYYPKIDTDKCIRCDLCKKKCNYTSCSEVNASVDIYFGWRNNMSKRMLSTSGGAFYAFAESFFLKYGNQAVVYGAAYNDDLEVKHSRIDIVNNLGVLRKSKYVQSNCFNVYKSVAEDLKSNKKVLFSGTPCEIQQLLHYLTNSDLNNLFTIDFICNGVSSPIVFRDYLTALEKRYKSKIVSFSFRNKVPKKNSQRFVEILFSNGKRIFTETDLFYVAFQNRLLHRESCFNCKYNIDNHCSDITLGDFWGIENHIKILKEERKYGISLIAANTNKGKDMVQNVNDMSISHVEKNHYSQSEVLSMELRNNNMDSFYLQYSNDNIIALLANYIGRKELISKKYRNLYDKYRTIKNIYRGKNNDS